MLVSSIFDRRPSRLAAFGITFFGGLASTLALVVAGRPVVAAVVVVNTGVLLTFAKMMFEQRQVSLAGSKRHTTQHRRTRHDLDQVRNAMKHQIDALSTDVVRVEKLLMDDADRVNREIERLDRRLDEESTERMDRIELVQRQVDELRVQSSEQAEASKSMSSQLRVDITHRRNTDISRISDRFDRLESRVKSVPTDSQSRSLLGLARLNSRSQSALDVVVLFTPQRTGSTRMFEIMRTHPAVVVDSTANTWRTLGFEGRRYPTALATLDPDGQEIEVQAGIGSVLPPVPDVVPRVSARWFVEKAHPEFVEFDVSRLVDGAERLVAQGRAIEFVHVVRRPIDAMWSMLEYKRRDPRWYAWLEEASIPEFAARSYHTIRDAHEILGGTVVDYSMDNEDTSALIGLGHRLGADDSAGWLTAASEWVDGERKASTAERSFTGVRTVERTLDGPDGIWESAADQIDAATESWLRLLDARSSG